jgi:hypothetical protein
MYFVKYKQMRHITHGKSSRHITVKRIEKSSLEYLNLRARGKIHMELLEHNS